MRHRSVPLGLAVALLWVALGPGASRGQPAQTADEVPATVAARTYGVTAVALYEAVVPGSRTHQPLAGQLNGWPPEGGSPLATAVRALLPPAALGPPEAVSARAPLGTAGLRRRSRLEVLRARPGRLHHQRQPDGGGTHHRALLGGHC
jgi:hypothetical protein